MKKRFLQYSALKSHLSKIVGVRNSFLLNISNLRRWRATMIFFMVLLPVFLPKYYLVRGVKEDAYAH